MDNHEWPLVFFTLLSQLSMGILLAAMVVLVVMQDQALAAHLPLRNLMLLTALLAMGVALVLSFLHLANPLHSVYALSNMGSSFLSREILMVSVFTFLLALSWGSVRWGIPPAPAFQMLFPVALLSGLILVWVMARLYMIPTVPSWNHPLTLLQFFNSGLLLGSLTLLLLVLVLQQQGANIPQLQKVGNILFVLAVAGVLVHLYTALVAPQPPTALLAGFPATATPLALKLSRVLLILSGLTLLLWWYKDFSPQSATEFSIPFLLACLLVLAAEILGRYGFYASYYRVGV